MTFSSMSTFVTNAACSRFKVLYKIDFHAVSSPVLFSNPTASAMTLPYRILCQLVILQCQLIPYTKLPLKTPLMSLHATLKAIIARRTVICVRIMINLRGAMNYHGARNCCKSPGQTEVQPGKLSRRSRWRIVRVKTALTAKLAIIGD